VVANVKTCNVDVFNILQEKNIAYVNYLMVRNGSIIQTHTSKLEARLDETKAEILLLQL
jgi:excinuclease ABC subunit C